MSGSKKTQYNGCIKHCSDLVPAKKYILNEKFETGKDIFNVYS